MIIAPFVQLLKIYKLVVLNYDTQIFKILMLCTYKYCVPSIELLMYPLDLLLHKI
jgi:hypothetical protein